MTLLTAFEIGSQRFSGVGRPGSLGRCLHWYQAILSLQWCTLKVIAKISACGVRDSFSRYSSLTLAVIRKTLGEEVGHEELVSMWVLRIQISKL